MYKKSFHTRKVIVFIGFDVVEVSNFRKHATSAIGNLCQNKGINLVLLWYTKY